MKIATNTATRFQPKPEAEKMVRTQVFLRPDQREAIAQRDENMSEVVRNAVDMYLSLHPADDDDCAAALDAMAADGND